MICDHPRNLTDEQAKAIAERGGVVCLTFVPSFVGGDLTKFLSHYEHGVKLVGAKALGLGSDFDGCKDPVLPDASRFPQLADALREKGVSATAIRSLFHVNLLRYFERVLPT